MSAGEYCNRDVVVTEPGTPVLEAAQLMREHHVGNLVVVDSTANGARPVGIVTDRDIVVEVVAAGVLVSDVTVNDIMSTDIVVVTEDTKLMDAISLMRDKGVRRLPVIQGNGALAGILAVDDVIELVAEQLNDLSKLVTVEQRHEQKRRG
jgi:predicted transcriptional regulator